MIDTIVINDAPGETRVALLAGDRTVEVFHHRAGRESIVGNIYLGRVTRVEPGLNAAFIDIGAEAAGFLNAADARTDPVGEFRPIGAYVEEGGAVLVQAVRDAIGGKGPRLTARPTLAGRRLVLLPGQHRIIASRRIGDAGEQARLVGLVSGAAGGDAGFLVRTAAAGAGADEIAGEVAELDDAWAAIEARRSRAKAPARLFEDAAPVPRALRDHAHPGLRRVAVDSPAALAAARDYCARAAPEVEPLLELHQDAEPVFERFGVEAALEAALEARVGLPSGGALTVEETQAVCAIDVDTGRDARGGALKTNLEAAAEVARQLRLRAIGGRIVVDFVHMTSRDDRMRVIEALREALAGDRDHAAPVTHTRLGLVETRRRRTRPSLAGLLTESCAPCDGQGRRRSAETAALGIARAVARDAASAPKGAVTVTAAPEVAAALTAPAIGEALAAATGRAIDVRPDPACPREAAEVTFGQEGNSP